MNCSDVGRAGVPDSLLTSPTSSELFKLLSTIGLPNNANYISAAREEINMKHLMISAHMGLQSLARC